MMTKEQILKKIENVTKMSSDLDTKIMSLEAQKKVYELSLQKLNLKLAEVKEEV